MANKRNAKTLRIAGTDYDRRRNVTKQMKAKMDRMLKAGKSYTTVADACGVSTWAVKYNTNSEFRKSEIARKTAHPTGGHARTSRAELLAYKAMLIKSRKRVEAWV